MKPTNERNIMTTEQKTELKARFTARPSANIVEHMAANPNLNNNEVWDVYEEWQDEDPLCDDE